MSAMKIPFCYYSFAWLHLLMSCSSQPGFAQSILKPEKEIASSGVKERIDHIDVNLRDQVAYVAAPGNNTVEVIDLRKGYCLTQYYRVERAARGAFSPKHDELFIAKGGQEHVIFIMPRLF